MKKMFSVFMTLAIIAALVSSEFLPTTVTARAAETTGETAQVSGTLIEVELNGVGNNDEADSVDAEKLYIESLFYGDSIPPLYANHGSELLTGAEKSIYEKLLPVIKDIADGKKNNTSGIEIMFDEHIESETISREKIHRVILCLKTDHPELFYWFGNRFSYICNLSAHYLSINLCVSKDYSVSGMELTYEIDNSQMDRARRSVKNAKAIAAKYSDQAVHEKIYGFAYEICSLNDYNYSAAEEPQYPYGDPWQLVYVFDEDPSTQVVCEGYSKAFQYLCDQSGITCFSVIGSSHMWNIVVLNGISYHVDCTWADGVPLDVVKSYHPFILRGVYKCDGKTIDFNFTIPGYLPTTGHLEYDSETIQIYPESVLKVSLDDYVPAVYTVIYDKNGGSGIMFDTVMTVGVAQNLSANNFTRQDYNFLGWSTDKSATKPMYTDKQLVKDLAEKGTVTLYAVWEPKPPAAVTGFNGTPTSDSVKLIWNKNDTADSYKIKQLVDGKWVQLAKTANNTTTSYTVSGLKADTEYKFAIYAFKGTKFSTAATVTVKTEASSKPTAVTGFKGTPTSDSVELTWNKNDTADSYKIKQLVNGSWKELTKTANNTTTSYTVSGLKADTEYKFAIYAFKGTKFSTAATVTVKTEASSKPTAVTGFKGTPTSDSVKLTWNKNDTADSYKIKQLVDGKWVQLTKTANNATTSYTVSGLKANTEYKFAIYAFKGNQFSAAATVTVKTAASSKPTAVTGFKCTPTADSVKLTWNKNDTADSYKIKQFVDGKWVQLTKTANNATVSYNVTGLKANTEYKFAIYAFKGTQFSAAATVTVKTAASSKPTAVTGFTGTPTADSVKLIWNKNDTADSYKIKQFVDGKWVQLTKTASNTTVSYNVTGLKANTEYKFAIYAFKGTQFSAAATITVKTVAEI